MIISFKEFLEDCDFDIFNEEVLFEEAEEYQPQKTKMAYKLFRKKGGKLFPLYVGADQPVEMGKWMEAKAGEPTGNGKVKSKLGPLAYRPGWHSGDVPVATHIGGMSHNDLRKPDYRKDDEVWCQVEVPDDHDWQAVANSRGKITKKGKMNLRTAHITDQVPLNGHYRYKTNSNMKGNWIISGQMKVHRELSNDEVNTINTKAGFADLPRMSKDERKQNHDKHEEFFAANPTKRRKNKKKDAM